MSGLGSPPSVCTCGHPVATHDELFTGGRTYCSECVCPLFELDGDR